MEQNLEYAQNRVEEFISELIHDSVPSEEPDAVFMAGIPGVGKTEVALGLANRYKNHIVIDADAFQFNSHVMTVVILAKSKSISMVSRSVF